MKLLFDANLSRKLVPVLQDLFPGSAHISSVGLAGETPDLVIWGFARDNGFLIVTADADFLRLSEAYGFPPKVIRLDHMNYGTEVAAELIRRNAVVIAELQNSTSPTLIIRR